jgi:hypothetical protein
MTINAKEKREARQRMAETGEKYTTALRKIREARPGEDAIPGCDYPDPGRVSMVDGHCQCTVCPRCGHHTGNAHQGHYWSLCQVTGTERRPHFCCPDNCEIEAL